MFCSSSFFFQVENTASKKIMKKAIGNPIARVCVTVKSCHLSILDLTSCCPKEKEEKR